ncbi:RHS repeat-associated core domain-containing protein [Microbacterium rhizomatis]|uniref:RHS repeat protein n=1 Tax=Microbacterium rhizomatis TaxID=1631477 RepID=A0A5J5J5L9_9MICO|nr:RHS repeat-associated core domain-containing protein [Microbacterium rhizomatis]KAA9111311.1 RHS repeat protein [Microbacterium rhizomatis]
MVGCLVLGAGAVSASAADGESGSGSATPVVGGFGLGDAIEGLIDERVGSFTFDVPVDGVGLRWDSRAVGADRVGFGSGWVVAGAGAVEVIGGLKVYPSSGGMYAADASAPSGMAGYVLGDAVFSQTGGVLPGRVDGLIGDREYQFTLSQTGGATAYFGANGDPLTQVDAFGNRTDWESAADGSHRLVRVVDQVGVVTAVDWTNPAAVRVTRTVGTDAGVSAVVELDGGRVSAVVDATGGRTTFGYDPSGLISRITGVSGAVTEVSWQTLADGSSAVDRVRVIDALTGEQLSAREWDAASGVASGWPVYAGERDVFESGDSGFRYQTVLSDGETRVMSEYNSTHLLIDRSVEVTTQNGPVVLQEQAFEYPDTADGGVPLPWDLPEQFNRPTTTDVVFRDAMGNERVTSEHYEFDTFGRVTSQTAPDGAVAETEYDQAIPVGAVLPVGLPLSETVTTPDGLVSQTRYELNPERTAPVVVETLTGKTGGELTRTARTEYTVQADGFVSEERTFGQGGEGVPIVTTHAKEVDLSSGTLTVSDTIAAGTDLAVTTREVTELLSGQPVQATDALGNIATVQYDPAGRVTVQTDPAGNTVRTGYRSVQVDGVNATVVTAPDGVVTTTEVDVLGRVVKITDNLDDGRPVDGHARVVESRTYPDPGTVQITDAWGAVTVTKQDVFGREVQAIAPTGLTKITRYDDIAHTVTTALTPTGDIGDAEYVSTQRMDDAGQVAETGGTRADRVPVPTISRVFDGFGRETGATDGTIRTEVERDVFGNPAITTITPQDTPGMPVVAQRRFDEFGTSVEKTLTAGDQSRSGGIRIPDILGRTLSDTDQDGKVSTYEYTADGLVAKAVSGYGAVTVNTYDTVTRALTETVTTSPIGEQVRTAFEDDPVTGAVIAVFDPADRAGTEISYDYDGFGNATRIRYPDGSEIAHTYDQHGRLATTKDVAGNITSYTFDMAGLLTSAVQTDDGGAEIGRVGYIYDEYARVSELSRGNGVTTEYTFTSAGEIATESTSGPDGTVQDARAYTYDERGNLTHRTDTVSGDLSDGLESTTTTTVYGYDEQDRLTRSTLHAGDSADASMLRDVAYQVTVSGDVSQETITTVDPDTGNLAVTVRAFTYTPTGEVATLTTTEPDGTQTTVAPTYDAAGNLTAAVDGTRYTYNALNQPVTETTPTGDALTTGYWATGQRASLTAEEAGDRSGSAGFYWDSTTLLNDTHAQGDGLVGTASYLIGATRHARSNDGPDAGADTVYYTQDRHGNTTTLTQEDGAPATRYTYTDYGTPTVIGPDTGMGAASVTALGWVGSLSYQPFQYAGEHTTPDGMQRVQVRTYDPVTMRFTTKDTARLHNTYNYANLNPVMMSDPTGRTPDWDTILNGTLGGLAVLVGVFSIAAAIYTGGAALAGLGAFGVFADAVSVAAATAGLVDTHIVNFMDDDLAKIVMWGETALGLGLAVAVGLGAKALSVYGKTATGAVRGFWEYNNGKVIPVMFRIDKLDALELDKVWAQLNDVPGFNRAGTGVEYVIVPRKNGVGYKMYAGRLPGDGKAGLFVRKAGSKKFATAEEFDFSSPHERLRMLAGYKAKGPEAVVGGHLNGVIALGPKRTLQVNAHSGHFGANWAKTHHGMNIQEYFESRDIRLDFTPYSPEQTTTALQKEAPTRAKIYLEIEAAKGAFVDAQ